MRVAIERLTIKKQNSYFTDVFSLRFVTLKNLFNRSCDTISKSQESNITKKVKNDPKLHLEV